MMIGIRNGIVLLIALFCMNGIAGADVVILSSGETLHGTVVEQSGKAIVVQHTILGRLVISRDKITSITVDPVKDENTAIVSSDSKAGNESQAESASIVKQEAKESAWKSRFVAGFGWQSGNTEVGDLSLEFTTTRERERSRDAIDARYYYGQERGDRIANKFTGGILHDWLFSNSPWSVFAGGRFDYDEFNSWEYRLSGHGGVGYQLIDNDDLNVILRGGFGAAKEFKSNRNQIIPEALLGGQLAWTISKRQEFKVETTLYPDLDDTGEFRDITTASWNYKLNDEGNAAFTLGLYNEYQSTTAPGVARNDVRIFGGLSFDF